MEDLMRKFVVAGLLAVFAAGAAYAESAAIAERQGLFKEMGKAAGPVAEMLQGKAPFDIAPVKAALATFSDHAGKLKTLFPEDSKEGGKTKALPAIWEKNAEFLAGFDKLKSMADAAATSITDEASFKANIGGVFGACQTCHESFQAKG
jgi:cytochrome c556